jgi:hypothetical protein
MNDAKFKVWMGKVDEWCWRMAGCSASDLADVCYADMYEDGYSPKQAARRAVRNEMGMDE